MNSEWDSYYNPCTLQVINYLVISYMTLPVSLSHTSSIFSLSPFYDISVFVCSCLLAGVGTVSSLFDPVFIMNLLCLLEETCACILELFLLAKYVLNK